MAEPFYVTTPIYYVNAKPHLGHAYTTILADVAARFHQMCGQDTFFLTGVDEHGDKVVRAAQKANMTARNYVDQISSLFRNLWPELNIRNNGFIRTTDPAHAAVVERILQKIYDAGDIYFSEYEGLYCFGCERFYTERELVDGKCPDHEIEPEAIKESNYFFRMSRYQDWLVDYIQQNPDFIRPERYRNEVLAFLRAPLEDLCISRPKTRLQWGITLPFDNRYVTYVWFDALLNYISALGWPDGVLFKKFWPVVQHITAKDILKPHGIYWPIMLRAAGLPMYRHLNVHGYWNVDQSKMSKSLGNVIDPLELKNVYGLDAFRYFLMREMVFGLDAGFNEVALVQRINADLANDLGNLFSRVLSMAHKYFAGLVPEPDSQAEEELNLDIERQTQSAIDEYEKAMEQFAFHRAMGAVWELIGHMNKCIDVAAPWVLAKNKTSRKHLETVIYHLLEGLRVVSGLLYPVMPDTSVRMQEHLGLDAKADYFLLNKLRRCKALPSGVRLPKTITLFPRVDSEKIQKLTQRQQADKTPLKPIKPEISYETFSQVDLRIATIIAAEPVPKAKKLIKLQVDMGEERTIVAGISQSYSPEQLIGKQVVVVANLKPAKLMGILSNGMLLAATDDSGLFLLTSEGAVAPGTPIS